MTMRVEKKGVDDVKKRLEMHKEKKAKEKREDYVPDGFEKRVQNQEEKERKLAEERKAEKKAKKLRAKEKQLAITDAVEEDETQAEMAAILGFTGFGGGK
jgi:U4/U6.U5 tri-snRNP component SNU23